MVHGLSAPRSKQKHRIPMARPCDCSFLSAIPSPDIHPTAGAGRTAGLPHLVVDGRYAGCLERIHITKGALVMPRGLGDALLCETLNGPQRAQNGKTQQEVSHHNANDRCLRALHTCQPRATALIQRQDGDPRLTGAALDGSD